MSESNFFDFNDAGEQRSVDVIPANTICGVQLTVRPGGAGDDGWLRRSKKDGASEALDCEFTVIDGEYAKRKIWALYTVHGTTPGHAEAAEISRKSLCAMVGERARRQARRPERDSAEGAPGHRLSQLRRIALRGPHRRAPARRRLCGEEHHPRSDHARTSGVEEGRAEPAWRWQAPHERQQRKRRSVGLLELVAGEGRAVTRPQWAR